MAEPKLIRAITKGLCPHCSKEILLGIRSFSPAIDWVLKHGDLDVAKEDLLKGIKDIEFEDEERKKQLIEMIGNKDFLIGPDEVLQMLETIKKDNIKIDDNKKDKTE